MMDLPQRTLLVRTLYVSRAGFAYYAWSSWDAVYRWVSEQKKLLTPQKVVVDDALGRVTTMYTVEPRKHKPPLVRYAAHAELSPEPILRSCKVTPEAGGPPWIYEHMGLVSAATNAMAEHKEVREGTLHVEVIPE